jgi:hypothetical protein
MGPVFSGNGLIGRQQALMNLNDFRGMAVAVLMGMVVVRGKGASAGITHGSRFGKGKGSWREEEIGSYSIST